MIRLLKISAALSFIAALGGCAAGVTHKYDNDALEIYAREGTQLAIGVQDRRTYVLDKQKSETFVGLSRGGYGNTFDVRTASGKPLSEDFAKSIVSALSAKGVKTKSIHLPPGIDEIEAIKRLAATGSKSIFILLYEWKADTMINTALIYDIHALVIDASGKIVSRKKVSGKDNLGGSAINPPEHSRNAVPVAFRKKLEELFASQEISGYL